MDLAGEGVCGALSREDLSATQLGRGLDLGGGTVWNGVMGVQ